MGSSQRVPGRLHHRQKHGFDVAHQCDVVAQLRAAISRRAKNGYSPARVRPRIGCTFFSGVGTKSSRIACHIRRSRSG